MASTAAGSTARLLQLCLGYFAFYVVYGVAVKYYQGKPAQGFPGMNGMEFLVYSTIGGSVVALFVCLVLGWVRIASNRRVRWGPFQLPVELLYIVPSGVMTAIVIPTTTLMYSLPISVMVAMVIMRGAIIVVSRLVDAVQIRQGLMRRKVYAEENWGVVFALLAVATTVILAPMRSAGTANHFAFLQSKAALGILGTYVAAYAIRIYIMNYFKNTRAKGVPLDNRGFFAIEQMTAFVALVVITLMLLFGPQGDAASRPLVLTQFENAFRSPHAQWGWAAVAGSSFGIVAFFSVFIFMFQGRTATFAGLVNRLTSLVAGTAATLVFHYAFAGPRPALEDWLSLGFILVAVWFLTMAERKRTVELQIAAAPSAPAPALQSTGTSRA